MNTSGEVYKHWYPPPIGCFFSHGNNKKHPRHFLDVVDDKDLNHTAKDNTTAATLLLPEFQNAVDCWEGLLRVTGGALDTTKKTFWYLIDFKWNGRSWDYATKEDSPGEIITMRQANSEARVQLTRKEAHEASKTLGVYACPNGDQQAQADYLRELGVEFADSYRSAGGLEPNDVWEGILTTIMATF
jgi:hypothetical protein